jgi:predicted O-methyltransferase YrrM
LRSGARIARRPFNSLTLRRYRRLGLPADLYPAIETWLTGRRGPAERDMARRVSTIRRRLLDAGSTSVADYGASLGEHARNDSLAIEHLTVDYVARRASVPENMGLFLHRCASGFEARRLLELGTCAGISGCYLASAPSCRSFVTIEVSSPLAAIARSNLSHITDHATVINAAFDEGIGTALALEDEPFDLVWIDGHHESEPTLRYFDRLRGRVAPGKLMLFDDIDWPQMTGAWRAIRAWPGFAHTINAGRFGIAVLKSRPDASPPQNWQLLRRLGIVTTLAPES